MSKRKKSQNKSVVEKKPSPTHPPTDKASLSQKLEFQRQEIRSGPIPSPDDMDLYGRVQPDFPERIMKLAEGEAEHRRECEKEAIRLKGREILLGQLIAAAITMAAFSVSGYALFLGHQWISAIITGSTIATLATVFVKGHRDESSAAPVKK